MKPVPKKKQSEPPDVQGKRFVEDAQRMIKDGELNPIEADEKFEELAAKLFKPLKAERSL